MQGYDMWDPERGECAEERTESIVHWAAIVVLILFMAAIYFWLRF